MIFINCEINFYKRDNQDIIYDRRREARRFDLIRKILRLLSAAKYRLIDIFGAVGAERLILFFTHLKIVVSK